MSLFDPIDIYCERLGPGLMAEPLNALSNLSFIVAAFFLLHLARNHKPQPGSIFVLITMVFIVGVGSGLFHSFANVITVFADMIPIVVFVFTYLWFALRRLVLLSGGQAACGLVLLLAISVGEAWTPLSYRLNGSLTYVPCIAAIAAVAVMTVRHSIPAAKRLTLAGIIFTLSLAMRSADMALCSFWPHGTHIGWHLLNGFVLYLLVSTLILHAKNNR